jgi:teichuronic acid exporter
MSDLAKKARTAVAWTAGLNILRDVVQFAQMLVVVRLLPPEAYGQFGLTNTIIGFMMVFSSREFIAHTLLVRDDAAVNYQDQFTAGCVIQGLLFLLANALATLLHWFPSYAPVATVLHIASFALLLDLPSELRTRMLERRMDWQRLRSIEAFGIVGSAALTLAMALSGAGVYALVVPAFVIPVAFAVDLFAIERWRPTFSWHADRYRATGAFGMRRVLSVSFVSASNLIESGTMARAIGYAAMGIFGRAIGMATLFCQRIAALMMSALYPVLARVPRSSEAYRRVSALVLRVVVWFVLPVGVVVSFMRDEIVTTLYGDRWLTVIPLVPRAMAVGVCLAAVQTVYSLLLANENPRQCFFADLWRLVGMAFAVFLVLPYGVNAYLAALFVVHAVALVLVLFWLATHNAITTTGVLAAFLPASASVVLAAITAETFRSLALAPLPPALRIVAYGAVFGSTYLLALRILFPGLLHEVVGYLPESTRVQRILGFASPV